MKKRILICGTLIVMVCVVILLSHTYIIKHSSIIVINNHQSIQILNLDDIHILKKILIKLGKYDTPSCSFHEDIEIIISYKNKENIFYIASDGCQILRKNSNIYIRLNNEMWQQLQYVLKKYDIII